MYLCIQIVSVFFRSVYCAGILITAVRVLSVRPSVCLSRTGF